MMSKATEIRTKRLKVLSIVAAILCVLGFVVILFRWHGRINVWESLYIFPTSFGLGILNSSQFVGVSAGVDKRHVASTISIYTLSQQIGMILGAGGSSALVRRVFRDTLVQRLGMRMDREQVGVKILLQYVLKRFDSHQLTSLINCTF